jgi:3-(3-hydroxy-phenyl)propionate hydroxylase
VYWPLEQGRCRWGFQIADAAAHHASMDRLGQLLAARAPWFTARPTQIYWSTLAEFAFRLSRTCGAGRVWLAGDAAHQSAPVAVQSMNSGLFEARELASRIAQIQRSSAAPSLLEEFGTRMHRHWEWLLAGSRAVRTLPGADPWVQQNASRIVASVPASGADLTALLEQIGLTPSSPQA